MYTILRKNAHFPNVVLKFDTSALHAILFGISYGLNRTRLHNMAVITIDLSAMPIVVVVCVCVYYVRPMQFNV